MTPTKQRTRPDIAVEVLAWRREQLERAGYPSELAEQISLSDADLRFAERLLQQGCAPELAAAILV